MRREGIELTPTAAEQVRQVMTEQKMDPAKGLLRVGVRGTGPTAQYSLELTDVSQEEFLQFETQGIQVVCFAKDISVLNGTTIDYRHVEGTGSGFVFDVPDESHVMAGTGDHHAPPPDEKSVRMALYRVYDPEVGVNVIDLGLIYGLEIEGRNIFIRMTLTTPACPLGEQIRGDAEQRIRGACPGTDNITITTVWEPKWSHDKMTPEGKKELGWLR